VYFRERIRTSSYPNNSFIKVGLHSHLPRCPELS
jgi:hypothetical protein